jgi:hypothetical protein
VERWSGGAVEWWSIGVLEYWSIGVLEGWRVGGLEGWVSMQNHPQSASMVPVRCFLSGWASKLFVQVQEIGNKMVR